MTKALKIYVSVFSQIRETKRATPDTCVANVLSNSVTAALSSVITLFVHAFRSAPEINDRVSKFYFLGNSMFSARNRFFYYHFARLLCTCGGLIWIAMTHYVFMLPSMVFLSNDTIVERAGAAIQQYLDTDDV